MNNPNRMEVSNRVYYLGYDQLGIALYLLLINSIIPFIYLHFLTRAKSSPWVISSVTMYLLFIEL